MGSEHKTGGHTVAAAAGEPAPQPAPRPAPVGGLHDLSPDPFQHREPPAVRPSSQKPKTMKMVRGQQKKVSRRGQHEVAHQACQSPIERRKRRKKMGRCVQELKSENKTWCRYGYGQEARRQGRRQGRRQEAGEQDHHG